MKFKRILTVQDISCVGQCSLTVALPILSACGLETAVLPSAVLSTHTGGFKGYTFRDLTDDMPAIAAHWKKEGIDFDCLYTGYLGSAKQVGIVSDIASSLLKKGCPFIVDPAFADNGAMYPGFGPDFAGAMRKLAFSADIILPNITEACLLTGTEYRAEPDEAWVDALVRKLHAEGARTVVLTGVSYSPRTTGVLVSSEEGRYYYRHVRYKRGCHGTGDIYSSAFVGALEAGRSVNDAARIAADFTVSCIRATASDRDHWYGARFEPVLGELIGAIRAEN
jgi:pyridoxine kinase